MFILFIVLYPKQARHVLMIDLNRELILFQKITT